MHATFVGSHDPSESIGNLDDNRREDKRGASRATANYEVRGCIWHRDDISSPTPPTRASGIDREASAQRRDPLANVGENSGVVAATQCLGN